MPLLILQTFINAAPPVVYDLSRSLEVHQTSMTHHPEKVVGGRRHGLMNKGDTVTWRARHLGRWRTLEVKITEAAAPFFFADEMISGDFKTMRHEHFFEATADGTLMTDRFSFRSPFGVIGKVVDLLFLKAYRHCLLQQRNETIKQIAEGDQRKQFLNT